MKKQLLLNAKGQKFYDFSDEAQQALDNMIDAALDNNGLEDFYDTLYEVTDDTFIYYADAWDYMKNYGDNDLESAVKEGFTNICQIAWYNLQNEFCDLMEHVGLSSEDFEGQPEDEETEE